MLLSTLMASLAAHAQMGEPPRPEIALALDANTIEVTARFTGQQVLLFGVVQNARADDDIVVILSGPQEEVMMARKTQTGPIWVNAKPVILQGAPSYHAISATRTLDEIAPPDTLLRTDLTLANVPLRMIGAQASAAAAQIGAYRRALVRLREGAGLFRAEPGGVTRLEAGLFQARVYLPAGSPTGDYRARAMLFRNGRVIAETIQPLTVERAGLDRLVYETAHQHSFFYGCMAVAFAVFAGWLAAFVGARR